MKLLLLIEIAKPIPLPRKEIKNFNKPESNEIEKIWRDLKVGEDGYLSLSELEKVCIYLGMNNLNQIVRLQYI